MTCKNKDIHIIYTSNSLPDLFSGMARWKETTNDYSGPVTPFLCTCNIHKDDEVRT